ncbi:ROK family protein [Tunturiibacter empetritectus]|uniref:Glucokinase n=1 Tax=Tunturiibacter lichenicola TaxID=2051959 RepID=A0A852VFE5_9BACT|nr:ROK family protein [Edaphobacter lichenicola]NYF91543.1 glucokinase [Edaphobacter lichenicola]
MSVAVAIELGGSHAAVGLVNAHTLIAVEDISLTPKAQLARVLPNLAICIRRLLAQNNLALNQVSGIGMGIAALVDWKSNRVVGTNGKYSDAPSIDLVGWSKENFGLPLRLENDARMGLLGEWYGGGLRNADSAIMLTFGTGIGCAALVEGKVFRSSQPQGGCLGGHIPVNLNGRTCSCGAVGCMEAEASTWALPHILQGWPCIETSTLFGNTLGGFKELFDAVAEGDLVAEAVRRHCIRVWAAGIIGLIHVYGPSKVLLGGGVMKSPEMVIPDLRAFIHRHAWTPAGPVEIQVASLGPHSALYGTIPLLEGR